MSGFGIPAYLYMCMYIPVHKMYCDFTSCVWLYWYVVLWNAVRVCLVCVPRLYAWFRNTSTHGQCLVSILNLPVYVYMHRPCMCFSACYQCMYTCTLHTLFCSLSLSLSSAKHASFQCLVLFRILMYMYICIITLCLVSMLGFRIYRGSISFICHAVYCWLCLVYRSVAIPSVPPRKIIFLIHAVK